MRVVPTPKIQAWTALPAVLDGLDGEHYVAQVWSWRHTRVAEATLSMPLHLRTEPENKASSAKLRQVPADVGQHHGTAREGDRHGSP